MNPEEPSKQKVPHEVVEEIGNRLTKSVERAFTLNPENAADLFQKARASKGEERLRHVENFKSRASTIEPAAYALILRGLMTTEAAIDELGRLGQEEALAATVNKFKQYLPGNKNKRE